MTELTNLLRIFADQIKEDNVIHNPQITAKWLEELADSIDKLYEDK